MLKIKGRDNKVKFVLRDEDEEPVSIDELILRDEKKKDKNKKDQEKKDESGK